eukprot:TRINITY_DN7687_c0_g2_i4.p1 TRINITY_DN7687_c0_g2~~TRINITY_DN7687_c0_g2_i4.p1  ORF type:complete len:238 (+),score=48.02 TRINITY_DN7687_c0_g2_i4:386-1099(+)
MQLFLQRGLSFETVKEGLEKAFNEAREKWNISIYPILCFLRDRPVSEAMETLKEALKHRDFFVAVGLDSSEIGNPPSKFETVFDEARKHSFRLTAHAGEEGPPEYIIETLDVLKVSRIDHGVSCSRHVELCKRLAREKICLTMCPLSNIRLGVFPSLDKHNIKDLLEQGLLVSVHSDDPSYFGGYLNQNFISIYQNLNLSQSQIFKLGRNAIEGSFLNEEGKAKLFLELEDHVRKFQ